MSPSGRDALRTRYPEQRWGPVPLPLSGAWGFRVQLEGGESACKHCAEFRGWLFDPHDAPLLPLRDCTRRDGCTCRYV